MAPELERLGVTFRWAVDAWAPEADTVVTVALGAVPETGSVLVASSAGAGWLPFKARRQVVLVPPDLAILTLTQALELAGSSGHAMVTLLTGPTRTADIEKVLVLGAQGPVHLEVALYQPEG
jgi:L-lactate dehydrogenase complex protein LldG